MKLTSCFLTVLLFTLSQNIFAQTEGELLFNTNYDYLYNTSPQRYLEMIDTDNDGDVDPVILISNRNYPGAVNTNLYYKSSGTWNNIPLFPAGMRAKGIQYCTEGVLAGKFLAFAGNNFAIINPTNWQYSLIDINETNFQSFAYTPDGSIFTIDLNHTIFKSTDMGVTFTQLIRVGDGDPNVTINNFGGSSELPIKISPNGQFLSLVGGFEDAAVNGGYDIIYLYHSSNFGETWQGKIIGLTGIYDQVSNRNYAPLFTNFSQLSHEVDNNGKTHVVINGYGFGILEGSTDTTMVFPVLYWNNDYDKWTAVTSPEAEKPTDNLGNSVSVLRPGNGIGNSYPTISITPEGDGIAILWQAIEFTSGFNSSFNIFPGDGGSNPWSVYYTDLACKLGYDAAPGLGGIQWFDIISFPTSHSRTEQYPVLAPFIKNTGVPSIIETHFIYQYDSIPGVSVLFQNDPSDKTGWYYNNFIYTATSVGDDIISPANFNLEQNYPNPFNPTTKISWQSPVSSHQTIKVFDVLGNEVATLVNEERPAGSYEVEFDASNLSSGVYFFKLQAGDFVQTRKMLMLK